MQLAAPDWGSYMLQTEFGLLKLGNQKVSRFHCTSRGGGGLWSNACFDWSLQESIVLKATVCFDL